MYDPTNRDYDKDFADFLPETAYINNAAKNANNLKRLGIDEDAEDTVFGAEFVYCGAHCSSHSAGWCSVGINQKRPLNATTREEALIEVKSLRYVF